MAHDQQLDFVRTARDALMGDDLSRLRVVEIGSHDVNGGIRPIFEGADYTGVDLSEGPGVDHVGYGHLLDAADGSFDLAISSECFEHDPHWRSTLANMIRMTAPGGLVIFTCAALGRPEHGTRRTTPSESPGTQAEGMDYYENRTAADFESAFDLSTTFAYHRFEQREWPRDLYFAGVKRGDQSDSEELSAQQTSAFAQFEVLAVELSDRSRSKTSDRSTMRAFAVAAYEGPVRLAAHTMSEARFQAFAYWYTRALQPVHRRLRRQAAGSPTVRQRPGTD